MLSKITYQNTFVKSIIWRIISIILQYIVTYNITNSVTISNLIILIDSILKIMIYFIFERWWYSLI